MDQIEVPVAGKVMLVVSQSATSGSTHTVAGIYNGKWPEGAKLSATVCPADEVYVPVDAEGIWFNDTLVPLTMANLLKVADFLHLDIPQPPLPRQRGSIVDVHA